MSVNTLSLPNVLPNPIISKELVVWPDDFLDIQGLSPEERRGIPFLIGSFDPERVGEALGQKTHSIIIETEKSPMRCIEKFDRGAISVKKIEIEDLSGEKPYWLALGGKWYVPLKPVKSRSKTSGAIYYAICAWIEVLKIGLLVQFIPIFHETSSHHHKKDGWIERNSVIEGGVELRIRENRQQLTHQLMRASPIGPALFPSIIHQLSTDNTPLLSVIEIGGDRLWAWKWWIGQGHQFEPL